MNCETCESRLIDLLYEEIEGAEAEAARAHVEACASCRRSYEKLGIGQALARAFPQAEPARALDARILAAARQRVGAEPARGDRDERGRDGEEDGAWAAVLRWLSGLAASPQLVMATIMMLVVSIGLWYLPTRRSPEAGGETVAQVDDQAEAAPSATLTPAEPLELDLDERTGRLRRRGEGRAAQAAPPLEARSAGSLRDGEGRGALGGLERQQRADRGGGEVVEGSIEGLREETTLALRDGTEREEAGLPAREARSRATTSAPAGPGAAQASGAGAGGADRAAEGGYAYAPSPTAPAQARSGAPSQPSSMPSSAGDLDVAPADDEAGQLTPTLLHRTARNFARNADGQGCRQAIPQYERLVREHPSYRELPLAMVELADCYRQMGRLEAAHAMYLRAERYTSVAVRARRGRYHVDQMRQSRARPAAVDEAAAEPANAY